MRNTDFVEHSHGIVTASALRASGCTERHINSALATRALFRVRRGLYALPTARVEAVRAVSIGGRAGCVSAARIHTLWTMPDSGLHVWIPPTQSRLPSPGGCRVHRDHGWSGDGPVVVSVMHCLRQIAMCQGVEGFLVALESALNKKLIAERDLDLLARRLPARFSAPVSFACVVAQSGIESLARWRLLQSGIVARPQVRIPTVGRVDLLIGNSLIVELDGREFHEFDEDRRRDANAAALSYVTHRYSYRQVLEEWPFVRSAIEAHMRLGLHLLHS